MKRHVVLIGLNYQNKLSSGDKNFWYALVPLLARDLDCITIISVRNNEIPVESYFVGKCTVRILYLPPILLASPNSRAKSLFWRGGAFPRTAGLAEKTLSAWRIVRTLREIHGGLPITHIHLMDNFGFANRAMIRAAKALGATCSLSIMSYQGDTSPFYHPYLRFSLGSSDLTVVPYSATHKEKLVELGLDPQRMAHIRWGVSMHNTSPGAQRQELRGQLRLPLAKPLFLWAGYIQQIQREDFLAAVRMAKLALSRGLQATFFFAFKPESLEKNFLHWHAPADGIHVEVPGVAKFRTLSRAADVFYSPVVNRDCILAPPLTWIELMGSGVPIVTSDVPGANEIVEHGRTGFLSNSDEEMVTNLFNSSKVFSAMSGACIRKVATEYNIETAAEEYLDCWFLKKGKQRAVQG